MTYPTSHAAWHRKVITLAVPIILANVTVPMVGVVDTAVTGHMDSPEPIAAVALGASIFSLVFWAFGFLRMGTGGIVAQAFGAEDQRTMQLTLLRSMLIATLLGLLIIALQRPLLSFCLGLIGGEPLIEQLTARYYEIRIWAAPATLATYVITGMLIGVQRMKSVFAIQVFLTVLNVALDLLFVPVLQWGIEGVAYASLISEYTTFALGLYLIKPWLVSAFNHSTKHAVLAGRELLKLLKLNGDIFIRTLLLVSCFFYFNATSAQFPSAVFAANVILLQIVSVCAYALDGFAHAAETLTGQAWGRRNKSAFEKVVLVSSQQALVTAMVLTTLIFLLGPFILRIFTDQQAVLTEASTIYPWLIALPVLSVWCYQLDGIFIGTTHTREMRNAMIISTIVFFALSKLLIPLLGNNGLWLAFSIFMVARAATLYAFYPRIAQALAKNLSSA